MKKRIKIFIDGASFTHRSLGTQALSICTLMLLSKYVPNAIFSILSTHPELEYSRCKKRGFDLRVAKRPRSLLPTALYLLREYNRSDIIVGMYGDGFALDSHLKSSSLMTRLYLDFIVKLILITLTRKPVIVFPSSIGPFKDILSRFLVRLFFNRTSVIMVREKISKRYLLEIGINKALIHEVPDVAYILPEASSKRINEIYPKIKTSDVLIGINVSQLINYESKNYVDMMAKLADYLSINLDATVLLIPHQIRLRELNELDTHSDKIGGDDITAVKNVYAKVKEKQKIIPIITEHEVDVLKKIISQCDLFIGARMHSIISALSMGVPTLGIAYSQKTPGIMRMVGLENYVCDFRTTTYEELISKINDLFYKRIEIRRDLLIRVKVLKKSVWAIDDIVKSVVSNT